MVRFVMVVTTPSVTPAALLLFNVENVVPDEPPMVCAAVVLAKLTVFDPAVNVPPFFVQLPRAVMVVPAVNVPDVRVKLPLMFSVAGGVKLPAVSVRF